MVKAIINKFFYLGMLVYFLSIAGCHPSPICIIPVDTRANSFKVHFATGNNCDRLPDLVERVDFYSRDDLGKVIYLWRIVASPNRELVKLQYGVLPEGFSEITQATLLNSKTSIEIEIDTEVTGGYLKVMVTE